MPRWVIIKNKDATGYHALLTTVIRGSNFGRINP
jgi:hypothetical protein